jgi:hypothetical protein
MSTPKNETPKAIAIEMSIHTNAPVVASATPLKKLFFADLATIEVTLS